MGITLCDESDIKARLQLGVGDNLSTAQQNAWPGLAEEATGQVEGFLLREWNPDLTTDPPQTDADALTLVPKEIRVVTSRMVVRTMNTPAQGGTTPMDGQQSASSTFGPMSYARGFAADSVFTSPWLSKADKLALARFSLRRQIHNEPMFTEKPRHHHWSHIGGPWVGNDLLGDDWGPW